MNFSRAASCLIALCLWFTLAAQSGAKLTVSVKVLNEQQAPLSNTTTELWKGNALVKVQMTDSTGNVVFSVLPGNYQFRISRVGYGLTSQSFVLNQSSITLSPIILHAADATLKDVVVTARKPFIELQPGKTIVNVEGSPASVGATVMEVLEKMPNITVDKDGVISLKGKSQVLVLIDNKPTYLSGTDLANLLNGMSASQLNQVEIMSTPPARYEAAGNAGIINLKTKKNDQRGFNGNINTAYTQGRYPKENNSVLLNYKTGRLNLSLNYSNNFSQNYLDLYADRTYFKNDGVSIESYLEQPSWIDYHSEVHSLRAGIDYSLSPKTSIGLGFTGLSLWRHEEGNNDAKWKNAAKAVDSVINTTSSNRTIFRNGGLNFNYHHSFSGNKDLAVDVDYLDYSLRSEQYFENRLPSSMVESSKGTLPTGIKIYSAKADYEAQAGSLKWGAGWKSSRINTDNIADYYNRQGTMSWYPDYGRTNHFLYNEYIHAFYGSLESKINRWTLQGGLRFEATNYDASQLGNAQQKDSSFSRDYKSLFPTAYLSYELDSFNTLSLSVGRRIDRPAFQKLNPFSMIINKYTYQVGNPYFLPQYTWNFEVSHLYKNVLISTLSYSRTTDYFSQIFYSNNGIITYTQGNLGELQVFGLSVGAQLAPLPWLSLSAQALYTHRIMEGQILKGQFVQTLKRSMDQANFNLNNQFRFKKGWGGELSGNYATRSRTDIQELVEPSGQLSLGVTKQLWQNKATVKLGVRDVFYTQAMIGFTEFQNATEYFSLRRDTRVVALSFTYRFGKAYKSSTKRSSGSASEEVQRVNAGN